MNKNILPAIIFLLMVSGCARQKNFTEDAEIVLGLSHDNEINIGYLFDEITGMKKVSGGNEGLKVKSVISTGDYSYDRNTATITMKKERQTWLEFPQFLIQGKISYPMKFHLLDYADLKYPGLEPLVMHRGKILKEKKDYILDKNKGTIEFIRPIKIHDETLAVFWNSSEDLLCFTRDSEHREKYKNIIEKRKTDFDSCREKMLAEQERLKKEAEEAQEKKHREEYAMLEKRCHELEKAVWNNDLDSVKKLAALDVEFGFTRMKEEFYGTYFRRKDLLYRIVSNPSPEFYNHDFPNEGLRCLVENYPFPDSEFHNHFFDILAKYRTWEHGPKNNGNIETARLMMEKYKALFPEKYRELRESEPSPYLVLSEWNDWTFEEIVDFYETFYGRADAKILPYVREQDFERAAEFFSKRDGMDAPIASNGMTALQLLCYATKYDRAKRLMEMGADPSACDSDGNNALVYILAAFTPIHIMSLKPDEERHVFETLGFLWEGLGRHYFPRDKYNMLIAAIEGGADLNQKNVWGWTPMTYACCWRVFGPAVDLFLKHGAAPEPMRDAAIEGGEEIDLLEEEYDYLEKE